MIYITKKARKINCMLLREEFTSELLTLSFMEFKSNKLIQIRLVKSFDKLKEHFN